MLIYFVQIHFFQFVRNHRPHPKPVLPVFLFRIGQGILNSYPMYRQYIIHIRYSLCPRQQHIYKKTVLRGTELRELIAAASHKLRPEQLIPCPSLCNLEDPCTVKISPCKCLLLPFLLKKKILKFPAVLQNIFFTSLRITANDDIGLLLFRSPHHFFHHIIFIIIVRIQKKQVFSGRTFHTPISGGSGKPVLLRDYFYSMISLRIIIQYLRRCVCRTIVHADNLRFFKCLAAYAVQTLFQILFFIINRHNN